MHLWTVIFQNANLLPEDATVNTWHFENTGALPITDYDNVRDMLEDFYSETAPGATGAITDLYSDEAFSGDVTVRAYDLDDPQPRVPVYEDGWTFTPSTAITMPAEVALVMSFQAAPSSGVSQASRRNRIYLGPFNQSTTAGTGLRPASVYRTRIALAATELLAASDASVRWKWRVWSPTLNAGAPVSNGWIDDAWDTQRRRGLAPTTRTLFTA